jgi:branched-chain amino acid transport system ATP-binding protein
LEEINMMLLELANIKFSYSGAETLKGVSITVEEGDIICLIGANGAGKTTTLRIISGLEQVSSGQIHFMGKSIDKASPRSILLSGIAQVPERGRVFRDMSVYENLMIGAYVRKEKTEINRDLAMVYEYFPILKERAKQKAGSLSGGEQQMLAIGRALMGKPRVLLMDEPTSGLAPMVVEKLSQVITSINKEGISIVLAEQNAEVALSIASYGYVMERGKVIFEGTAEELVNNEMVKKAYLGM